MTVSTSSAVRPPEITVAQPPGRRRRRHRDNKIGYIFLAPWLVGLALITIGPMIASLYLSFTDYTLLGVPHWTGLKNYVDLITSDSRYLNSVMVTLIYVVVSVPLQLGFALALALLLNRGIRGLRIYRSLFYLPSLLGSSVAIALLWRRVFGLNGVFNQLLALIGIDNPPIWIGDPKYALGTLILLHVWTFGSPMIIFLAGLRQIPTELYEAARIDGATSWSRLIRITLPLLSPVVFFNLVLQMINAFQSFTQAYVVSGGSGGPSDSTLFYTLYLYQQGFSSFKMGYASAMAWLLFIVIAGFTLVNFLGSKRWVYYGE